MATKKKDAQERVQLWIGPGRFSFPYFSEVDSGREFSDDAYKCDFLMTKADFKAKGKAIQDAVLKVGREAFGDKFKLKNGTHRTPFKDTDEDDKIENEAMKGCILIRAKSGPRKKAKKPAIQPFFIGPRKDASGKFPALSKEEIAAIKGGDYGMINVTVYSYDQKEGGVTLALNGVQFWKPGEAFGQGRSKLVESAEELEEDVDAATDEDAEETSDDDDSVI